MGGGMRTLKIVTIGMGVLILLGTTVILVTIVKRALPGQGGAAPDRPFAVMLEEPGGTNIAGVASVRDRLAIQLRGGGADRVILIDPTSGAVVGRIGLAR